MAHSKLSDIHPILPVRDLRAALEHYRNLGFKVRAYAGGDDYGFVDRDGVSLHLTFQPTSYYREGAICVAYLDVEDADTLFLEWTRPGIGGETTQPADMPWLMHEGIHTDPDGNVIRFGSPVQGG
jgi:catechol 2,3-dioxygenase-like lactoylglutathione lyase family enzyme